MLLAIDEVVITYRRVSVGPSAYKASTSFAFPNFTVHAFLAPWIMSHDVETLLPDIIPQSLPSSITNVSVNEKVDIPEDRVEKASEKLENDWENDPDNARNWSSGKKWTATAIVSGPSFFYILFFKLKCFLFLTGVVLHTCLSTG